MGRLDGKVALITGGGSGMGMVASKLFAARARAWSLTDVADEAGEARRGRDRGGGRRGALRPRRRVRRGRRRGDGGAPRSSASAGCTSSTTTPA